MTPSGEKNNTIIARSFPRSQVCEHRYQMLIHFISLEKKMDKIAQIAFCIF